MATRIYSEWYSNSSTVKTRVWFDYAVSLNDSTRYIITVYPGFDLWLLNGNLVNTTRAAHFSATNKTTIDYSRRIEGLRGITGIRSYQFANSFTWEWAKGQNTQTKVIQLTSDGDSTIFAKLSITIPALVSYNVTYNARTGTGAPATQKKYYGQSLTLSTVRPTKSGYTFLGWATTIATAEAGTKNNDYDPGDTIAANFNSAISLYAVWERTYIKPTISNLTIERCLQDGTADDEGTYAKVEFDWGVFQSSEQRYYGGSGNAPYSSNTASSCTITIDGTDHTFTSLSNPVEEVITGPFSTDNSYDVIVSITDSQTVKSGNTTTATGTLSSTRFPMDFNADATAVGFFQPAPDDDEGMFIGKDLHIKGNLVVDYIVEQGTSSNWSYRKYNSGIYEAWYTGTNTFAIDGRFSSSSPVLYYGAVQNLSLPFAVTSIQYVDVKALYSNWGVWTAITQADSSGIKYQSLSAVARNSVTYAIRGYIKGTYSLT